MTNYAILKNAVIDLIDDESPKHDVLLNYGIDYDASTELDDIGVTGPIRYSMPKSFNKVMRSIFGNQWIDVGPLDLVSLNTIGGFILLACGNSRTPCPGSEPT